MESTRVADRYSLDREIGRGGSGAVWMARDEVLGRVVAMKRVGLPPGAASPDMVRAEREARLAAQVNHPNVVSVFDFVEDDERQWLVMEYVDGTTLARLIREQGPLSPDELAPIMAQVADALAAAHRVAIVHRDVKPSNILVAADGQAKLSDFGIARAVADASLTQTGLVTGSPAYLSPEVATGGSATPASDVWSLGASMYHALAGHPPYEGDAGSNAVLGILYRIAHEDPPRLRDAGWLGPLLEMTMTKDPALRPSMSEVAEYLHAQSREAPEPTLVMTVPPTPSSSTPPPPPPPPPPATIVATETTAAPPSPPVPDRIPLKQRLQIAARATVLGAAVIALLAAVGVALALITGDDEPQATAGDSASQTRQQPSGPRDSPSESPTQETPPPPTAQDLERFAASYVETASSDPAAGFELLTPDYQNQSPDYHEFWGSVRNPRIQEISANPEAMTVTYTYRYEFPGRGNVTETVTLYLVQDGDQLLIQGAQTR